MVEGKWFAQGADLSVPLSLREAGLGRGRDALDAAAQQVVVYRESVPTGTGRLWWEAGEFWLGEVCVLPGERGKGFGDLLVRLLLFKAMSHNARSVALRCPQALTPFFGRYGFAPADDGEPQTLRLQAEALCLGCRHAQAEPAPQARG